MALEIFRTEANSQIVGGKVLDGVVRNNSFVEVMRAEDFIVLGDITELQSAKQSVNEVEKDEECGLKYEGKPLAAMHTYFWKALIYIYLNFLGAIRFITNKQFRKYYLKKLFS